MSYSKRTRRLLLIAAVSGVVGYVASLVIALVIDGYEDRSRPMQYDVVTMAALQHEQLRIGESGVELELDDSSDPVVIGDEEFRVHDGVELTVEQRGDAFCVSATNEHGDRAEPLCVDGTDRAPALGALSTVK